jgi:hypothetical protein
MKYFSNALTRFTDSKIGTYFKVFPIFKSAPTVIKNDLSNFSTSRYSIYRACESLIHQPHLLQAIKALITHYKVIAPARLESLFVSNELRPGNAEKVEVKELTPAEASKIWYQTTPVEGKRGFLERGSELWQIVKIMPLLFISEKTGKEVIQVEAITGINMKLKSVISPLGKLGLKYEPAGKVRVFAMVDPITQ